MNDNQKELGYFAYLSKATHQISVKYEKIVESCKNLTITDIKNVIKFYNPIGRFVAYIHSRSLDPYIILELTRSKDYKIRIMGIKSLAKIGDDWQDWQYQEVRQSLDFLSQIILANYSGDSDIRLFTKPPSHDLLKSFDTNDDKTKIFYEQDTENLSGLLENFPPPNSDEVLSVFRDFSLFQGNSDFLYHDPSVYDASIVKTGIDDTINLKAKQLSALLIHTSSKDLGRENCSIFIQNRGLQIMQNILNKIDNVNQNYNNNSNNKNILKSNNTITNSNESKMPVYEQLTSTNDGVDSVDNADIKCRIADLIGNVCMYPDLSSHIHRSGWLSILAEWSHSPSISLSLRAYRALHNLDQGRTGFVYPPGVYKCWPLYHTQLNDESLAMANTLFQQSNHQTLSQPIDPLIQSSQNKFSQIMSYVKSFILPKSLLNNETVETELQKTTQQNEVPTTTTSKFAVFKPFLRSKSASQEKKSQNSILPKEERKKSFNTLLSSRFADIYFIHGLMGNPFKTWRRADRPQSVIDVERLRDARKPLPHIKQICWPKEWLSQDIPNLRIMLVSYETYLSEWAPKFPIEEDKRSIEARSHDIYTKIVQTRTPIFNNPSNEMINRPIIFVTHSMGGLLIKHMLTQIATDVNTNTLLNNTLGIVFYSTPHAGSPIAKYTSRAHPIFYPSREVQQLILGCPELKKLNEKFVKVVQNNGISCLSFGETKNININYYIKLMVVPTESSNPGIGEFHSLPCNHLYICKPHSRDSPQYSILVQFIQSLLLKYQQNKIFEGDIQKQQPKRKLFLDETLKLRSIVYMMNQMDAFTPPKDTLERTFYDDIVLGPNDNFVNIWYPLI